VTNPTFIITRDDQVVDAVTLTTQALTIGRQIDCEILLNHPTVSRIHAGINEADGRFYLINLSTAHPVKLNSRLIDLNQPEALADGDVAQIGSFFLHMGRVGEAFRVHVTYQVAANIGEGDEDTSNVRPLSAEPIAASPQVADALKEFWDKRSRDKMAQPTPLHPRRPTRPGKAQFNWSPTRDLVRAWPISILVWSAIIIGAISVAAAFWYAKAYSPDPISSVHEKTSLRIKTPAGGLAKTPNSGSCTTCHSLTVNMETNCASCHQTEAFAASMSGIPEHVEAGVGCLSCHAEHQGADFQPAESAVTKCVTCHNDANKNLYRGRRVFTPHGGTVGYPVIDGKWVWRAPDDEAWKQKQSAQAGFMQKARERVSGETDDQWRSRQFHVLHLFRVRAQDVGLPGNRLGEMSCSSCHNSFDPIDRVTPATTCARCHNGDKGQLASSGKGPLIPSGSPNCTSCHVQHVKQTRHWNTNLLTSLRKEP
jgi:hypothetical protein